MTHTQEHVVIKLATPINSDKPKLKVWHCAGLIAALAFIAGVVVGANA